jgi:ATP-dependent Clp protease ATP-binding subunit ClpA
MKPNIVPTRTRRDSTDPEVRIAEMLSERIVGQQTAIDAIVPYVMMHQAGLSPDGRPAGVFLLLGPTGTGKTKTVEALADVLHGNARSLLRIDCGEYQLDHEVAKLIGAPPGYLGHRETHPLLTQQRLNGVTSDRSPISLVLFDEIEKAAPSMNRLLLGVLDKGVLRLGDNSSVNFSNSLIFMTSNLGAREMQRAVERGFGFSGLVPSGSTVRRLDSIAIAAVRKRFTPEFVNRIDSSVTYHSLSREALEKILELQLQELQTHIFNRLGPRGFRLDVTAGARRALLDAGTSDEFGARQLKRVIHRNLTQPLAAMVAGGRISPAGAVRVSAGCKSMVHITILGQAAAGDAA